ncbi:hypothetical protein BaRGS_00029154, partial [Batillaria attramentaria]
VSDRLTNVTQVPQPEMGMTYSYIHPLQVTYLVLHRDQTNNITKTKEGLRGENVQKPTRQRLGLLFTETGVQ